MDKNELYYGDNLDVLRRHIKDNCADVIYLDPPFNSQANYNVLFTEQDGSRSSDQIQAFEDSWIWGEKSALTLQEFLESAPASASLAMQAFQTFLGGTNILAYLAMMAPRLLELKRVLKPTGTIFLHCDPTASHYLKILMDSIFGAKNYRNEIVWCYAGGGIPRRDFPRKHDVILRYSKTEEYKYKPVYRPYSVGTVQRGRTAVKGIYAEIGLREEGTPVNDWWADVPKITSPSDPEKLGYPTQKSEALLERILQSSASAGDVVLDPFCGCGTAVAVAQKLKMKWIGIDITHLAIGLIKNRLLDAHGPSILGSYEIHGEPTSLKGAEILAQSDRTQFQYWALGLVKARPAKSDERKGPDKGIDGRLFFHDEPESGNTKQVIFSVKSGKPQVSELRDLRGVVDREKAALGVLISLHEPTKPMKIEAASSGFYDSPWGTKHSRLQILTIADLFTGKKVDMPPTGDLRTFKKAPKVPKLGKTPKAKKPERPDTSHSQLKSRENKYMLFRDADWVAPLDGIELDQIHANASIDSHPIQSDASTNSTETGDDLQNPASIPNSQAD